MKNFFMRPIITLKDYSKQQQTPKDSVKRLSFLSVPQNIYIRSSETLLQHQKLHYNFSGILLLCCRMVEKLRPDELEAFKEAFDMFDKNMDGTISTKELHAAMRRGGQNPTESEVQDMINTVNDSKL